MDSSKLIKSVLRSSKTTRSKFSSLIKIANNRINLQQEGLEIIRKITNGKLLIFGF
jgi:hypothetical protein